MKFALELDIPPLSPPVTYRDQLLLTGSCFTEHMADRLSQHRFRLMSNPHGILFNPLSVVKSLNSYVAARAYKESELFFLNELWNSWDHHTRFSDPDPAIVLEQINASQHAAAACIRKAGWIMITLGSAFQYQLKESGQPVANNHRAPAEWFIKKLLSVEEIVSAFEECIRNIRTVNPEVRFLFTISPVRHIRDGVIANNRSKARLLEAVHTLRERQPSLVYFPAYELVIDILRDYRYYDIDLVHPNYQATQFVWEQFVKACIEPRDRQVMARVHDVVIARNHKPRFPDTEAHRRIRRAYRVKVEELMKEYPFLDLQQELEYFS